MPDFEDDPPEGFRVAPIPPAETVVPFKRLSEQQQQREERRATPYVVPDPASIPKRAWLYGRHYMRGIVSATVAPGGFGKTTLSVHEAICMAITGLHVWYISAEDDFNEIHRRIAAHLKRHNISPDQIKGNLFVDDKLSFPLKIARTERNGIVFDEQALSSFENAIAFSEIAAVILDPFVSFHMVSENDTSAMDAVIKRLGEIAVRKAANIELSHHVRKPPTGGVFEITVHDARGAGAIVNAVRSCRVLNQMTRVLAEQVGITDQDRTRYIRIDPGKRNMAPPEAAKWMELQNVEIANGDFVQALVEYEYKVQATNTDDDMRWLRITLADGRAYRAASNNEGWLGVPMATHFGRSVKLDGDRKWLNGVIKRWANDKLIDRVELLDEHRKPRPHWVLGDNAKETAPRHKASELHVFDEADDDPA